jgi:hypothetical protein
MLVFSISIHFTGTGTAKMSGRQKPNRKKMPTEISHVLRKIILSQIILAVYRNINGWHNSCSFNKTLPLTCSDHQGKTNYKSFEDGHPM